MGVGRFRSTVKAGWMHTQRNSLGYKSTWGQNMASRPYFSYDFCACWLYDQVSTLWALRHGIE